MWAAVALVGVVLMTAAATPSATAATWSGRDPSRDVVRQTHSPDPAPCGTHTATPVPGNTAIDLTRFVVRHDASAVQLRVQVRELRRQASSLYFEVRTHAGRRYQLAVERNRRGRVTTTSMGRLNDRIPEPDQCGVSDEGWFVGPCRGLAAAVDYRKDSMTVTVPGRCLGSPRWVRASASLHRWLVDRAVVDAWVGEQGARFSPRVWRR